MGVDDTRLASIYGETDRQTIRKLMAAVPQQQTRASPAGVDMMQMPDDVRQSAEGQCLCQPVLGDAYVTTAGLGAVVMFVCILGLTVGLGMVCAARGGLRLVGLGLALVLAGLGAALFYRRLWRLARERATRLYAFANGIVVTRPGHVEAYLRTDLTATQRTQGLVSVGSSATITPAPILELRHN